MAGLGAGACRAQRLTGSPALDSARGTALIESAPIAIYHVDDTGTLIYANPEYRLLFGLKPQHGPDDWAQGVHPDDRARMQAEWADFCANPRPMQFEYRAVPQAGSVRYLTERVVRLLGAAGFVGTISDVTELQKHRTLLETLIANLPLALIACDADGNVTHYNHEAAEMCTMGSESGAGTSPEYPVAAGIYLADASTPVDRADRPLARTLRGETVQNLELVIRPRDSLPRVTLSNGRQMVGPNGQPMGAVVVTQDITERRVAEQELEKVHKQLLIASRQAGMAEVASNVLHNVGNVLNSVNVSATLVAQRIKRSKCSGLERVATLLSAQTDLAAFLESPQGRHLQEYLKELAQELLAERDASTTELAALRANIEHIKEIVAMQQGYAKRGGLIDTIDIRVLAEDSLRMNEGAFSRHGVTVVRDFAEVPLIQVDKHKVLQILVNVIRNAKYACSEMQGGEKRVTVRIRATADSIVVAVIDTGIGIPAQNLERIFNHGFTTRADGHGFGLHSSALAAHELGGSLYATSAGIGQGATFTLTLPLTHAETHHRG
jgi:PAS domain S-box-containing protein